MQNYLMKNICIGGLKSIPLASVGYWLPNTKSTDTTGGCPLTCRIINYYLFTPNQSCTLRGIDFKTRA